MNSFQLLEDPFIEQLACHEDTRQLVYRRGPLGFRLQLPPHRKLHGPAHSRARGPRDYRVVLNPTQPRFEGFGRVPELGHGYPRQKIGMYGQNESIQLYLPSRSAQVLAPKG